MQAGKGAKTDPLSDEARAVSDFKISKNELVELVNKYKTRTYDEEIRVLENLGGKWLHSHSSYSCSQALKECYRNLKVTKKRVSMVLTSLSVPKLSGTTSGPIPLPRASAQSCWKPWTTS